MNEFIHSIWLGFVYGAAGISIGIILTGYYKLVIDQKE